MGICIFEIVISLLMIIWLDIDSCYWDSDCFGIFKCLGGQCEDCKDDYNKNDGIYDSDGGGLLWSIIKIIVIIFFVVVVVVILCLYYMCKNVRKLFVFVI